jgi:hypothetical protein
MLRSVAALLARFVPLLPPQTFFREGRGYLRFNLVRHHLANHRLPESLRARCFVLSLLSRPVLCLFFRRLRSSARAAATCASAFSATILSIIAFISGVISSDAAAVLGAAHHAQS